MQTFDVSANILNDRLTFSTAKTKLKTTQAPPATEEPLHIEPVPVVRSFAPCARTKLTQSLALAVMQLVTGVVLFGVLVHRQRLDAKFVCGAALLATPLVAVRVAGVAPSLPLLGLLALHDALVVVALAA
jgi:hypothetical protein